MTRHTRFAFAIVAVMVLLFSNVPEARAAWGYSDIYYNGSTVEGYSATLRDWWESDSEECVDWRFDSGSGQWYCALAYYHAYWVSLAASLQAPWGTAWSDSTWDLWYSGLGTVVAADYGRWTESADHYMGQDNSYRECWNANACSGWQFLNVSWWSLGSSSASTYVAPPPPPPPQPTSFSLSASEGYAGIDCYTITVGNGANMLLDLRYTLNSGPQSTTTVQLNSNSQWSYCLGHYETTGLYQFWDMKNNAASNWVEVWPQRPTSYTVRPPQPTSLSISPAVIARGQSYTMTVGNGAVITMAEQYTINGGAQSGSVSVGAQSPGSATGVATISTNAQTPSGKYIFTAIRNTLNTPWVSVSVPLTICAGESPTISSITPSSGIRGTSVSVTITGTNLCGLSFSTTASGLTFSGITTNTQFTSATATFTISSSATLGTATVTLTNPAGTVSTGFSINALTTLTKEYIYLGPRVVAIDAP